MSENKTIQFIYKHLDLILGIVSVVILLGIFNERSRALLSVGMIAIILCGLFVFFTSPSFSYPGDRRMWFQFAPLAVLYFIGLFWTSDFDYGWTRCQVKLPLLALPIGMYCLSPVISYRTLQWIFLGIVLTAAATAAGSLLYYAFHFEEITESYKHAKTLPVVIPHIRYSLIVSIAIAFAVQLGRENFQWKFIRAPFLYAVAVFLFIFLHILAVRSGLLALYAGWITVILAQVFYTKSYRYLWAFPILSLIGGALYWFSPSLRNKAHYMKQDVGRFTSGKNVNNYSDGNRLLSMKIGWEIAKDHLWTGVGSGDAQQVMQAYYAQHYPEIEPHNRLIPHNQFIYILLVLGIPGLLVFIALLCIPLMIKNIFQDIPVVIVLVSLYSSFLSEATLEIQQGVFIASYLVGLAYWKAVVQRPLAERVS